MPEDSAALDVTSEADIGGRFALRWQGAAHVAARVVGGTVASDRVGWAVPAQEGDVNVRRVAAFPGGSTAAIDERLAVRPSGLPRAPEVRPA